MQIIKQFFSNTLKCLQKCGEILSNILGSRVSRAAALGLGQAAGVGGFVLALPIFLEKKIEDDAAVNISIAIPATSLFIFGINNYIRSLYFENRTEKLRKEKKEIDRATKHLKHLELESKLITDFPNSYQQILASINSDSDHQEENNSTESNDQSDEIVDVLSRNLSKRSQFDCIIKYPTSFFNISASVIGGASSIFIHFAIAAVLKEDFDNDGLNYSAISLGTLCAIFCGLYAIVQSRNESMAFNQEKNKVLKSINQYCSLYKKRMNENEENSSEEMKKIINSWENRQDLQKMLAV